MCVYNPHLEYEQLTWQKERDMSERKNVISEGLKTAIRVASVEHSWPAMAPRKVLKDTSGDRGS